MPREHEYTSKILDAFREISKIPRRSKHEEKISAWLVDWAESHGLATRVDDVRNVVIEVPATPGYEGAETLVVQGHMDMVCEKTKDSQHDFDKDPIQLVFTDDGWLAADRTTLGADNGIAIAMAMVAATDPAVAHPPLELLFTVDEETGLTGASSLQPGFVKGRVLLNVDSEDEGVFTVGCAGGEDASVTIPFRADERPDGYRALRLSAGAMSGGHSGVDIAKGRANAIQVVARAADRLLAEADVRLCSASGGTARNAIPRDVEAVLLVPADFAARAGEIVEDLSRALRAEYAATDPRIALELAPADGDPAGAGAADTRRAVDALLVYPHGVADMSKDIEGLVETSNNLAKIEIADGELRLLSNQRSSNMDRLALINARVEATARLAGGEAELSGGYPAWQPNMDSKLLARCVEVYEARFGEKPVVEAIHAGLECGIIGAKYEGMDMISFGPTIENPHSPDERIDIETIGKVWDFMVALFESYRK